MLKFTSNGKNGSFQLNLPSQLGEITPEYLTDVTKDIKVSDNYSLIGICYREKLSTIIFDSTSKKKNTHINIIPIFIKSGKTDNDFIKSINIGEKLIIAGSDIALGHQVVAPRNTITINNILRCTMGDPTVYKAALEVKSDCYFLEFKLIPNCNIHGCYSPSTDPHMEQHFVEQIEFDGEDKGE